MGQVEAKLTDQARPDRPSFEGGGMFEPCIRVKHIMQKFGFSWFVAGGWAIDLYLGKETRKHEDIEIGIYRKNQMKLYRYFENDRKYYINNKSLIGKHIKEGWNKEYLRLPIHEIHVDHEDLDLEVLLDEWDEGHWVYRRNEKIRLDEGKAIRSSSDDIPYLCPEIVLLYKTKDLRDKDILDFSNALPLMSEAQISWLLESIDNKTAKERISNLVAASS